jgi:hypothetical protein
MQPPPYPGMQPPFPGHPQSAQFPGMRPPYPHPGAMLPPGMLPPGTTPMGQPPGTGPAIASAGPIESANVAAATAPASDNATVIGDWQIFKTKEDKVYYFNKRTQVTTWEKPIELLTGDDKSEKKDAWQEFKTPEGKPYYFNAKVL